MTDKWCHRCQIGLVADEVKYTERGIGRIVQRLCRDCTATKITAARTGQIYDLKIVPLDDDVGDREAIGPDGRLPWERACPSCGAAEMQWCSRHGETLAGPLLMCAARSRVNDDASR